MIRYEETKPGEWQFSSVWKAGTVVKTSLVLKDVNGDTDEREVIWTVPEDLPPFKALKDYSALVDLEPFWDASSFGTFLRIKPTNPDNTGTAVIEIEQGG